MLGLRKVLLTSMLFSGSAISSPRITVEVDGSRYTCGSGGGGGTDSACVETVSDYCQRNTSFGSNACFDKATAGCRGAGSDFASCVDRTSSYCQRNTSRGSNACFEMAVDSCHGNLQGILEMMDGVKHFTEQKERGLAPVSSGTDGAPTE